MVSLSSRTHTRVKAVAFSKLTFIVALPYYCSDSVYDELPQPLAGRVIEVRHSVSGSKDDDAECYPPLAADVPEAPQVTLRAVTKEGKRQ